MSSQFTQEELTAPAVGKRVYKLQCYKIWISHDIQHNFKFTTMFLNKTTDSLQFRLFLLLNTAHGSITAQLEVFNL